MTIRSTPNVVPLAQPSLGEDEWQAVREPIFSGQLTQGKLVEAFETEFAGAHGAQYGIACTSATTGLHTALKALGIGPGDEVIVPAFTWLTSANAVVYCGAKPVFVDISLDSFNLDPSLLADALSTRTKAIIVVHLFGHPADFDAITNISGSIPIIEDSACAAGTLYKGRPAGSLGIAGVFSFHPRKVLTTGEGGMITTSDPLLAETAKILRNHGASLGGLSRIESSAPHQMADFEVLGFNYRYTDLQAAVGRVQLKKLDSFIRERELLEEAYRENLKSVPWLTTPRKPETLGSLHSWQSYVVLVDEKVAKKSRNQIMIEMQENGIQTRPGTHAIPNLGYYKNQPGIDPQKFPSALKAEALSIALPLFNRITNDQQMKVIKCLLKI